MHILATFTVCADGAEPGLCYTHGADLGIFEGERQRGREWERGRRGKGGWGEGGFFIHAAFPSLPSSSIEFAKKNKVGTYNTEAYSFCHYDLH